MKFISILTFFILTSLSFFSQTIVSTDVQNKNVILEEFTGIHCGYCPFGHAIAQGILDDHPNDAFVINIHTGGYATPNGNDPDFRTEFGSAIASQSGLVGYPAGTVNRHLFAGMSQGSGTAMSRGDWVNASNQILAQESYVNVGVEATLNLTTRELNIHVEAYYTGNSPESTNMLNVVILQDTTRAYQSNGGTNYNHMHRLVDMVTGQWGEEISTTTSGSFIDRNYTYSVPSDYNDILVDLKHIKIVAFISETSQEIITGDGTYPTYIGSVTQNDVSIEKILIPEEVCETSMSPIVTIKNLGTNNLTSVVFDYAVNEGALYTYTWSGNLQFGETVDVTLSEISYTILENNTLSITSKLPNNQTDENSLNNALVKSFTEAFHTTSKVNMDLKPGPWGFEISWELLNPEGVVIYSGEGNSGNTFETFFLDLNSCYVFNLYDSYGNGFRPGGSLRLTGTDGIDIRYVEGDFGSIEIIPFKATTLSDVPDIENNIKIYPNPIVETLNIDNVNNVRSVIIFDTSGKQMYNKKYKKQSNIKVNLGSFRSGIYFVNIYTNNEVITKKISVIK